MLKSLVINRNLTNSYQNLRQKEKEKVHRFDFVTQDSSPASKSDKTEGEDAVPMKNVASADLLPDWIELVDECNFMLSSVREKVKELEKAQNMNILNVFSKTAKSDYQRISNLSNEITSMFKKIENNMNAIPKEVDSYVEHQLRSNAKAKIASHLIPLSITFRKIQKNFYDSLQNDSQNIYSRPDVNVTNNAVSDELVQESVQIAHTNIADRTMRLQQIAVTVQELKEMYSQLSTMVVEQGSMLDQIDYNVKQFSANSQRFSNELKLRYERDNPRRAIRAVRYLVTVIFVQLICVIIKFA